ncbi:ABC-type uncharacterized transport system, permease component, partial [Metamycoplasma alkalescens]
MTNKEIAVSKKIKNSSPMKKLQISFLIPYIIFAILFIILPMIFVCIYAFKPLEGQTKLESW